MYKKIKENVFYFNNEKNIIQDEFIGICADIASVLTPTDSVFSLNSLQACPITNSGFSFDIRIDGEKIKTQEWHWVPNAIARTANTKDWCVETLTVVAKGKRGVVQKIKVTNKSSENKVVPVQIQYSGVTRKEDVWGFEIPKSRDIKDVSYIEENGMLTAECEGFAYVLTTSLENMKMFLRKRNSTFPQNILQNLRMVN